MNREAWTVLGASLLLVTLLGVVIWAAGGCSSTYGG